MFRTTLATAAILAAAAVPATAGHGGDHGDDGPFTAVAKAQFTHEIGSRPFRQPHRVYAELGSKIGYMRGHYYAKIKRLSGTLKNLEDGDPLKCPHDGLSNRIRSVTIKARLEHPNGHAYRQEVQPDPLTIYCEEGANYVSKTHALEGIIRWDPDTSDGVPKVVFSTKWDKTVLPDEHDSYAVSLY